jgi:hypothetical protein
VRAPDRARRRAVPRRDRRNSRLGSPSRRGTVARHHTGSRCSRSTGAGVASTPVRGVSGCGDRMPASPRSSSDDHEHARTLGERGLHVADEDAAVPPLMEGAGISARRDPRVEAVTLGVPGRHGARPFGLGFRPVLPEHDRPRRHPRSASAGRSLHRTPGGGSQRRRVARDRRRTRRPDLSRSLRHRGLTADAAEDALPALPRGRLRRGADPAIRPSSPQPAPRRYVAEARAPGRCAAGTAGFWRRLAGRTEVRRCARSTRRRRRGAGNPRCDPRERTRRICARGVRGLNEKDLVAPISTQCNPSCGRWARISPPRSSALDALLGDLDRHVQRNGSRRRRCP